MVRWDDVNYVSSPCNYFISLFPVNNILLSYIFILIPVSIHNTYTHTSLVCCTFFIFTSYSFRFVCITFYNLACLRPTVHLIKPFGSGEG